MTVPVLKRVFTTETQRTQREINTISALSVPVVNLVLKDKLRKKRFP
jgi:hypothetical protein